MNEFWAGILGALVGGGTTLLGQWVKHRWETHDARKRDEKRETMLK